MAVRYNPVKGPSLPGSDLKEKKVNEREKARAQSYQSGKAPAKPKNTGKGRGAVKTASSSASFSPVQGTTQHLDQIRKRTTGGQTVKQTFVPDSGARFVPQGKVNPVKGAESPLDRMRARTESSAQDDSERIGKALRKEYDAATPTGRKVLEKHGVLGPDEFSQIMAVNRVFRPGKSNGVTSKKTKYQMAIEGQFGDLTTPELHKRIRENEKKIASLGGAVVPNSVMAQGLERQNRALMQIILDRDKEERERRHRTELNELQRRKTDPDFYEKAKPTHSWMQTGDSDYIFINGHAGVGLDYSSGKLYETTRERTLATMTRDEIALYNYLYNVDGRASAKRYLELIEPALNRRRAENDARETVRFSDEHPVLATIDTWLNAPARGASGALAVADDILKIEKGEIVDVNSQWHALGNETKLARKTVSDKIEKAVDWEIPIVGNVASFAYNTANSIMDSVVLAATGSAFAPVGTPEMTKRFVSAFVTLAMSSDSAAGTIVANKEKGYSDIRAVGLGLTTGLIEAMTEKMAIDEIMKAPKSALKSLGIGFLSEGTEEVASGVANMAVDRMVNGTDSEISQLIAAYMSKGYDKYSATARALADSLVPDFLAGGLSGMAMSGVFDAAGLKSNETSDGEQTKNPAAETQQDSGKVTFEDVVFMTGDKKESPKYDYTKSFSQQVDDFKNGNIPKDDSLLIGGTGDVYQQIGLNPLPMAINQTHVDYALNGTKDADHFIGESFLKQLPDAIQNPVAIIASESRPTESIVALLPFVHNGKTVIAPVEIDGSARFNNIRFDVNAISSVYAKGNMSASTMQRTNDAMKKLHDAIQKDTKGDVRLYYWNKNEALALLQRAGLQLPGGLPKGGFIHSVRENGSKVKPKFENVTETQQFQRWFRNEGVKGVPPSKVVDADGNPEVMFYQGINAAASGDYFYAFSRNEATSKRLPGVSRKYAVNSAYLNIAKPMKRTVTEKQYQDMQYMGSLIGTAKHSGKDGLILDIQKDGKIADTIFVVFDEKQMKATNNVGTFFPDSDNPRYSVGTKLDEKYESPENAVVLSEARGVFEKLGFTVTTEAHISDMPENVDGYVDFTNKEVYINPKAENPQEVVIKHELIHILERSSGSRYVVAVKEAIMAKMPKQWEKKYQENWAKYEKLSKSKPELAPTEKRITSETIADFAMYFSKDDVIRHYAQNPENRTFMQVVKDFFAYIRLQAKVLFKEGREAVFWNSCARKWEKALTKAMNDGGNVHVSGNDARSMLFDVPDGTVLAATEQAYYEKIIENYRNELSKYKQGKFPERGYYVLGRPVPILRKYLKSNDEMILPTDVIVKATGGKHNISVDELVNLAEKMIDPLMILESDTVKNGYVIFLEMVDKNNVPVFATVHTRRMEGRLHVTRIASLYSKYDYESFRDKTQNFINEQVKKGRFKYANKKSQSWFSTFGLQLPSVVQTFIDSNTSLSQDKPGVNSYSMQKTEKDADDVSLMVSDSGDTAASETTVEDLQMELEEIDSRLENDELTEEEERKLERRSRSLQRKIMIALAKESSAKKQPVPEDAETENNARSSYHTEKLRDAVETYHTTGDTSGIPTKKSVNASQKRYNRKLEEIDAELDAVTKEFFRGELIPVEREALEARHKQLLAERNSAVEANRVLSQVKDILSEIDTVARPNHGWVEDIAPNLVDKKNVLKDGTYGFNDFERNLQHFFWKYFDIAKEKILKPLYDSKKAYADYVTEYSDRIYNEVVKELGIKKGSKESKAVQWLGERERPQNKKLRKKEWTHTDIEYEPYTYETCVKEFGEEKAAKIQQAVNIFRECYDEMLDDINRTRAMIYPNNPDKLIPKRKDYFRHFQEMNNSLPGLWATLKSNIGISPELVGVSEETKPKSMWQSMAQMRTGKATKYDAVGGFLDYLPQAAYMTHIDPNIVNIRSLAYDLAMAKAKQGANGNPDANSFIRYLQNYANKLAGKTVSHLDRAVHDSTVGRSLTAAVGWFNNRAKANAVLGNFSSMLSQFANILNIIGSIKNEADVFAGAWDACLGLFGKGDARANYEKSGFLKERFIGKKLDRFERYGLTRLAADALGIADEIGTRITWCAAYREAQRLGVDDMVGYADSLTRKCVAGRGIGEVPLNFESTVAKLFLPFRLEVNNNINVYRDILFGEDYSDAVPKQKIRQGMSDEERFKILKDRIIKVAEAKKLDSDVVTEEELERLKSSQKGEARPVLKKLADYFGVTGMHENKDIELEFEFSNNSIRKSINTQKKRYGLYAKMLTVFDEVIENAVGIEVHPDKYAGTVREEKTLKQAYELVSAFSDETGVHPVKLTVKEYDDRNNKLHVAAVLNENGNAVAKQVVPTLERSRSEDAYEQSSEISIAQLLASVKDEDFEAYIPKQFRKMKQNDFDRILSGKKSKLAGAKNVERRTRKILELFVASAILNAVMAALKSDEFNPLEDLFGADEEGEERDVLDRLRDLGVDYADGIGDGVVFDPIAAIASGVHQGLTEDEDAGAWKKAGLAMLRPLQNVTGDYLSNDPLAATAIGAMGVDSDAISKLFNDSLYVSPGTGAPVFSSLAKSIGYATDGKWASAGAEALKTFALPFGGSQVDKSVRGIFEAATGASTTERPYERMISDKDGILKYLIEPNAENWAKSVLFGPTAFSGASDAFYNSDGKKLTEEETKEVLKLPDYDARKTLFDELIAGKEYRDKDEKQKQMDEAANTYKESVKGDSIVYQMYQDGYKNASPFLQVYLDMSMTVDGTKYEVKLTADEGTAANEALTDVLSERFRELDGSERFRALPKEERESHIDKIRDLEHKHIKTEFLHDKGIIPDDLYVEMTFDYEKSRANQDRKLFVDDAQSFIESNAQVSAEQYLTYVGEGRATDEVVRQVRKYTEYASHRAPTDVDVELMELSNRLQVENPKRYDLNVYGNASGLINFTKKGVEYYIDMPAEHTYELMAMTDDACRAELSKLFKTKGYTDATDEEKADMISKVKSKVRAGIKDKLKAKYKSVKVDDFDKILAMGGTK